MRIIHLPKDQRKTVHTKRFKALDWSCVNWKRAMRLWPKTQNYFSKVVPLSLTAVTVDKKKIKETSQVLPVCSKNKEYEPEKMSRQLIYSTIRLSSFMFYSLG